MHSSVTPVSTSYTLHHSAEWYSIYPDFFFFFFFSVTHADPNPGCCERGYGGGWGERRGEARCGRCIHVGLNWKSAIRGSDPQRDFFFYTSHKKRVVLCQMLPVLTDEERRWNPDNCTIQYARCSAHMVRACVSLLQHPGDHAASRP